MLIESQPQQSTTPPTPQLAIPPAMSSPTPHGQYDPKYDMVERLKHRVEGYRQHHQISLNKNQKTFEAQNIKMKSETQRLTQQFLSNNHNNTNNNKSKQQKSVNSSAAQRNANKRSNASANASGDGKCDASETKPSKMSKVANNRNTASNKESANNPAFRNNCAKFGPNSQSIQLDVKMKPSVDMSNISANSRQLISMNSTVSSATEIKREVIDNSYLQSMTFEQIHDFLKDTNTTAFPPAGIEPFGPDELKDILNDSILAEDGFGAANDGFADEDFIKKFLEDINDSNYSDTINVGLHINHMNQTNFKGQPMANAIVSPPNGFNCNSGGNPMNPNLNINSNQNLMNGSNSMTTMTFMGSAMPATNSDMTSYHPIQPRLQQNLMSNIPNRSSLQINTNQPTMSVNNTPIRHYINQNSGGSAQAQSPQLLLQQMPVMQQTGSGGMTSHALQTHQSPQSVHILRMPNAVSSQKMTAVAVVPKTEDMSGQLSIQVPQQTQQMPNTSTSGQVPQTASAQSVQAAANASIKLKQMAQQAQQKTHHWVITHSNAPIMNPNQPQQQTITQQIAQQIKPQSTPNMASPQRMTAQTMQTNVRPGTQNQMMSPEPNMQTNQMSVQMQQNQSQSYFGQQMPQQMYWHQQTGQHSTGQHNAQHNTQHQSQHQPQHQQPSQPVMQSMQSQNQTQAIGQQNMQQNQQNYANYWSHPTQMGQMVTSVGNVGNIGSVGSAGSAGQQSQTQSQHYFNNNYNNYF